MKNIVWIIAFVVCFIIYVALLHLFRKAKENIWLALAMGVIGSIIAVSWIFSVAMPVISAIKLGSGAVFVSMAIGWIILAVQRAIVGIKPFYLVFPWKD